MRRSTLYRIMSGLSVFAAVVSAATHQLGFLLINFFFAVFNYYLAEGMAKSENESEDKDNDNEEDKSE